MRNREVVIFAAVVVADQAGHLLEPIRLEVDHGSRAEAVRLLPPGDQGLEKQAAQRFTAVEPQVAGAFRQAEEFGRPRRAQPLEVQGEFRRVEVLACRWGRRFRLPTASWCKR